MPTRNTATLGHGQPLPQTLGHIAQHRHSAHHLCGAALVATIAKNEGIPISLISEGLGHTSEKTTQIYLNSFAVDTLNKVNENVADAVSDCIKNAGEKFICLHNTDKT